MNIRFTLKDLIIIVSIAAIIVFCFVSIQFEVMPFENFPSNFSGAILGALIGSLITVLLLIAQSNAEEQKGKDIRILSRKISGFKDFINDIWKIWKKQKISIEEFDELTTKYYQNLMIYIKKKRIEEIGNRLTKIGEFINKAEKSDELREQIVIIINELSKELELGGQINPDIIKAHEKIINPVLFRKELLNAFNEYFVGAYEDIFINGQWQTWNEGKNVNHEDMVFEFKNYKGCSLRFGFVSDENGNYLDKFFVFLIIPYTRNFNSFNKYRMGYDSSAFNRRIPLNYSDIFKYKKNDMPNIPIFNFSQKELENIKNNYEQIFINLAERASELFMELKTEKKNTDSLSILKLLEDYYGK